MKQQPQQKGKSSRQIDLMVGGNYETGDVVIDWAKAVTMVELSGS